MREGSPKYHYDVPAINFFVLGVDPGFIDMDIEGTFPRAKKYEPLDSCLVINNDVVDISLTFNGSGGDEFLIPADTIRRISREEVGAIWQMRTTNLAAATNVTLGTIAIELWRAPEDIDSIARGDL